MKNYADSREETDKWIFGELDFPHEGLWFELHKKAALYVIYLMSEYSGVMATGVLDPKNFESAYLMAQEGKKLVLEDYGRNNTESLNQYRIYKELGF
jgi:hypothetical protein